MTAHATVPSAVPTETRGKYAITVAITGWCFALLTGWIESATTAWIQFGEGVFIFWTPHVYWLAPLGYLALFTPPTLLLSLIAAVAPRAMPYPVVLFCYLSLAVGSLMLPISELQRIAQAALALGVAVQGARFLGARPAGTRRWMVRGLVAMSLAVVSVRYLMIRSEARAASVPRSSATPATASSPNVLLLVLDCVRAANLGTYGYARRTSPNLDRLAREGTTFEWAFSTSPWSLPSHATLFTGTHPQQQSGGFTRPLDATHPTLAERLDAWGYATGGATGNLHYASRETGLARGFRHYVDYPGRRDPLHLHTWLGQTTIVRDLWESRSVGDLWKALRESDFTTPHRRHTADRPAQVVAADFLEWQATVTGRPFFAFLNLYDAHAPYEVPRGATRRFEGEREVDFYDEEIAHIDHHVGLMLDELRRRGVLDRTLVIVTADHGEQFGERGLRAHGNGVFTPVLHVPLIMRLPGVVPADHRVSRAVSLADIPATVLDLAGDTAAFRGRSLRSQWAAGSPPTDSTEVVATYILMEDDVADNPTPRIAQALVTADLQYVRTQKGTEHLFAYRKDWAGTQDLGGTPDGAATMARLRERLKQLSDSLDRTASR